MVSHPALSGCVHDRRDVCLMFSRRSHIRPPTPDGQLPRWLRWHGGRLQGCETPGRRSRRDSGIPACSPVMNASPYGLSLALRDIWSVGHTSLRSHRNFLLLHQSRRAVCSARTAFTYRSSGRRLHHAPNAMARATRPEYRTSRWRLEGHLPR